MPKVCKVTVGSFMACSCYPHSLLKICPILTQSLRFGFALFRFVLARSCNGFELSNQYLVLIGDRQSKKPREGEFKF